MVRRTFVLAALASSVLALAVSTLGCSMCASPYDYCGPTMTGGVTGGGCAPCMTTGRTGSILAPGDSVVYESETSFEMGADLEPGRILPMPGTEMVGPVLIRDEPVETATTAGPGLPAAGSARRLR